MGLHPYAEQFAQAGMAVLVFDYRGFGGSDGEPRHHISWMKHLEVGCLLNASQQDPF